jgi:predicted DNA-binding protein (UPF0251 family)
LSLDVVFTSKLKKELAMQELYTMSKKELDRLEIIGLLQIRKMKQQRASEVLGVSIRQVQRLLKSYRIDGPQSLISKKRGRISNNRLSANTSNNAVEVIKKKYSDFGPTLATDKLREQHEMNLSVDNQTQNYDVSTLFRTVYIKAAYSYSN